MLAVRKFLTLNQRVLLKMIIKITTVPAVKKFLNFEQSVLVKMRIFFLYSDNLKKIIFQHPKY